MATRKTTTARHRVAQAAGQTQSAQPDRKLWPIPHDEATRVTETEPVGEVSLLVHELHAALQQQDVVIGKLEAALGAVLVPAPAPSDADDGRAPSSTALGGELAKHVRHVQGNTRWLDVTLGRLSI